MNTLLRIAGLAALFVTLAPNTAAQGRIGSIYNPDNGPFGLVANKTARRMGDLVTVVINESQDVKNQEKSDLSTQKSLSKQLLNFDLKPNAFSTLPAIETGSSDTFAGTAKYEKKGTFSARLTAIVVDTLPNGNLVIQGRREIRIDGEVKLIEFSGICRRYDVTASNTIQSELVANAHVSYSGSGPLTRATNRGGLSGWLHGAINWLWPF